MRLAPVVVKARNTPTHDDHHSQTTTRAYG